MNFSENLKLVRQQQALTQTEVADKLHVSRKTISSWENERSYPDIVMLIKIGEVYQLSLDTLLKEDLGMVKHYENQATVNRQDNQLVRVAYYLNIILLLGEYLSRITHFGGAVATEVVVWFWLINLVILGTHYHNYASWVTNQTNRWRFGLVLSFALILNLAVSPWHYLGQSSNYLGELTGLIVATFIATFSTLLVFMIQPNQLKNEN